MRSFFRSVLWLAAVSFVFPSFAKVIETKHLSEVVALVDADTLLIFDLDNTIIQPNTMLGGEEWYDYKFEQYKRENKANGIADGDEKAKTKALNEWTDLQYKIGVERVEKDGDTWLQKAQAKGAKTMALTARPFVLAKVTEGKLAQVSLPLWANAFQEGNVDVVDKEKSTFQKSIMYVGVQNGKGPVLVKFLEAVKKLPKKIVFVDNKEHHVKAVEAALKPLNVEYIGCRHGASDLKISQFDPKVADSQLKNLN